MQNQDFNTIKAVVVDAITDASIALTQARRFDMVKRLIAMKNFMAYKAQGSIDAVAKELLNLKADLETAGVDFSKDHKVQRLLNPLFAQLKPEPEQLALFDLASCG